METPFQMPHIQWIGFGVLAMATAGLFHWNLRIRRKAHHREELFRIIAENAADMIALVDVKGKRLYNSPAYKRVLGYSAAELGETSAFEQIHPDDRFKVLEAARTAKETGVGQKLEYRIRHKNGSWKILESVAGTIRDGKGQVSKLVIVNRDITERKQAEAQIEHNLFHDALTALPNRRLFLDRLERVFIRGRRDPARHYAVLFVDLDAFKAINDKIGENGGDRIILEVSRRLSGCLRDEDTIAITKATASPTEPVLSRLGGDEFTLLLDDVGDPTNALRIAKRIHGAIAAPIALDGNQINVSASIGIALSSSAHQRPENILQEADVAMRRAKALGGCRCELYDELMHGRAIGRLQLEIDLRHALERREFLIHYQPILHLPTGRIVAFEALLRWQRALEGVISPHKFLEAAEDIGLLVDVGRWALSQACHQLAGWQRRNPRLEFPGVALNVSAREFADPSFLNGIRATIRETGLNPSRLQLEFTEEIAGRNPQRTLEVLSQLRTLGVSTTLDDFGAGRCSLTGLRDLPIHALKIDRTLVNEMMANRSSQDIVELIVAISQKLKLKLIAEGIETAHQVQHLTALGCEFGQGYFFSQPLDAAAAESLLLSGIASARTAKA